MSVSHREKQGLNDDQQLLERFLAGDEAAFEELVKRHQRDLYQFIWRYVRRHADTADLCQAVFVQVFVKAKQFRGQASFKTWLYQIAVNACKNFFRSEDRRRIDDVPMDGTQTVTDHGDTVTLTARQQRLQAAIAQLPPKQRLTLQLRLYQDLSFSEIGQVMECPVGTAKANFHFAVVTLRKLLEHEP